MATRPDRAPGRPAVSSAGPEYVGLLLADGRLPTGAHTQSAGLEPALRHGVRLSDVPAYVTARLRTVTEVEAAAAVVARHGWLAAGGAAARAASALEVDRAWRVRTLSDAVREASDLLGRSYRRLAERVWPLDLPPGAVLCRAVVLGTTAAAAGLDAAGTARLVGYDDVQTVVAAALKLDPFDPADGVAWVVAAGAEVDRMVARVSDLCHPDDLPAHSAPQLEHWAQGHRTAERRLYRA